MAQRLMKERKVPRMMKVDEFIQRLKLAASVKSLYVKGCFGAPMNDTNKKRYTQNNDYNKRADRIAKIMAASYDTFGSDCCGIIKGCLWNFSADPTKRYGGAEYKANGVPDVGADDMINACKDATTDFSRIEPGMLVWMSGHVGIYIGDGQVVESTKSFADGCQITHLGNLGYKTGNWRTWKKCGHLPWVDYSAETYARLAVNASDPVTSGSDTCPAKGQACNLCIQSFQRAANADGYRDQAGAKLVEDGVDGPKTQYVHRQITLRAIAGHLKIERSTGEVVKWLQGRLNECMEADLEISGEYDAETVKTVKQFQKAYNLAVDGMAGYNTLHQLIR